MKPSTRITYASRLDALLVPRFGDTPLDELNHASLANLDAELARDGSEPSTRRNFHIVFRSVIRAAVEGGLRLSEVRGLRWPDVDLKAKTITIRRSITRDEESTPKSGNHDVLPIVASLLTLLEAAKAKRESHWANVALTSKGEP